MFFSYRTRQKLSRVFPHLLTLVVVIVIAAVCGLLWLQRFVIYTPQGARIDFALRPPIVAGQLPQKPIRKPVNILYPQQLPNPDQPQKPQDPDSPQGPDQPEMPVISDAIFGYYTNINTLILEPEMSREQLSALPAGTAVMVEVANFWGSRYYTSDYGTPGVEAVRATLDALLEWMSQRELHMIALLPAFRDHYYARDNTSCGLPIAGGYLWPDSVGSYWLNPRSDKVLTRLTQIIRELQSLGFDEVVFDDFTMPAAEEIVFVGDRKAAIYEAAETLVTACANENFTVSFITDDMDFILPLGNCRLYIENAEGAQVEEILQQLDTPDDTRCVVFFCSNFDDRFQGCGVLRPLELAQ